MSGGERVLPTQRLGQAWDALVAEAAAEMIPVDTSLIIEPLGRRLTRVEPPRRVELITYPDDMTVVVEVRLFGRDAA